MNPPNLQRSPIDQGGGQPSSPVSSPPAGSQAHVQHLFTRSPATDLEDFWQSFNRFIKSPLDTHAWFSAAAASFAEGGSIDAYMATADDGSQAVAAFAVSRHLRVNRSNPPGEWLGEPFDLPHTGEAALRLLIDQIGRSRRPIRLMRLYEDSPTLRLLQQSQRIRGHLKIVKDEPAPVLLLDPELEEPTHRLNSGRRSDLRRARRHAEEIGPVEASVESPTASEAEKMLQAAFDVEGSGWKSRSGSSILANSKYTDFFTAYCLHAAAEGQLRIAFLRLGGRIAAAQIAIERGSAFWILKIGYDPELTSCSPGILLMQESIKYAASRKLERFELLGVMEPWLAMWKPVLQDTVTVHFYPRNSVGVMALAADRLKPRMESIYHRIRTIVIASFQSKFISGVNAENAIALATKLVAQGNMATIGYWHGLKDSSNRTEKEYHRLIELIQNDKININHLSIKLPAIDYRRDLLTKVADHATRAGISLHCDSHSPEEADHVREIIEYFGSRGVTLGYTIPARWERSTDDAQWACSKHLTVRVVKGQWPDPQNDPTDLRAAYLKIIDALCANDAAHVCVATHDTPLVEEAVRRLHAANIPCHLELLYGLPTRRSLAQAKKLGLDVRLYVPYGTSYLPYSFWKAIKNPRLLFWIIRGWLRLA